MWPWFWKWKTLALPIWRLELITNKTKQNYLKQYDLARFIRMEEWRIQNHLYAFLASIKVMGCSKQQEIAVSFLHDNSIEYNIRAQTLLFKDTKITTILWVKGQNIINTTLQWTSLPICIVHFPLLLSS